ncbi:MAG: hypothetical protein IJM59_02465 [Proteobacteria bacterium]|nr:hypothetical protein [Pseudomonadota bacterium]
MDRLFAIATNPILRTVMMGITGGFLAFFLCIHTAGNYLIFIGPDAYNGYSHFLLSLPFLPVIEGILVLSVLYHAIVGVWSKLRNHHDARERGYAVKRNAVNSRRNIASRTMHITGTILLIGLIYHVAVMKFGEPDIEPTKRNLYDFVLNIFSQIHINIGYSIVLTILAIHLFHGLGTLYESFGIAHRTWLRRIGQVFGILLAAALIIYPWLVYLILV